MAETLLPASRWYTTREAFKRAVMDSTSVTDKDDLIDEVIAGVSEDWEELTGRRFIPWTGVKEYDWQSSGRVWLGDDLLSVTSVKYGDQADNTVVSSDYFLYPLNAADDNRPYEWIEILLTDDRLMFADTKQADIAIDGKWGYSELTRNITTINEGAQYSASDTTLTVASGTNVEVGMTLLIGTEQLFTRNVSTNDLKVDRGVNGTTAAAHNDGTTVYAILPPARVRNAVNALAARSFMRGDSAWSDRAGSAESGFTYMKALPAEVAQTARRLRRTAPVV